MLLLLSFSSLFFSLILQLIIAGINYRINTIHLFGNCQPDSNFLLVSVSFFFFSQLVFLDFLDLYSYHLVFWLFLLNIPNFSFFLESFMCLFLFLTALGLHCRWRASSSGRERGPLAGCSALTSVECGLKGIWAQ